MGDKHDGVTAKDLRALVERYRVTHGDGFNLDHHASDDLPDDVPGKHESEALLQDGIARMAELQGLLYADARWSLLVVVQAMDAGGKDSTIKHVMSGINPQGVCVTSFKAPAPHERAHDFLWRVNKALPARGMIGIFNRSHYEDVLISRVHPDLLDSQNLPQAVRGERFWDDRIADIAAYEAYLARQGVRILKIFLNVGRDEQRKRMLSRLDEPEKNWKFDVGDLKERDLWPAYRHAYQAAIAGTAAPAAPWFVVPADRKWFTRLVVAEVIIDALVDLDLHPPAVDDATRAASPTLVPVSPKADSEPGKSRDRPRRKRATQLTGADCPIGRLICR